MMRNAGGSDLAGESFWRFSLALYTRPGVAGALVALQDRAERDVNLILFALWVGATRGHRLADRELADAKAASAAIAGSAVVPLRRLRRKLRGSTDLDLLALRPRIAALEIAAERQVQSRLAAQLSAEFDAPAKADRRAAAQANLNLILGGEAGSPEAGTIFRALVALMRAT
jgi:uncharacterized protein (TIGR02444 family)